MMKKLTALALCLALMLSLSGAAFAVTQTVNWEVDKSKTLTVSCSGEMPDYSLIKSPWASKLANVKEIIIFDGTTSIGDWAFADSGATAVTIPGSVEEIGKAAFKRNTKLTELDIPAGVTELEEACFESCTRLKKVSIHEGLTEIGDSAFGKCTALESVALPASLEEIGGSAFQGCEKLKTVYYAGTERQWAEIEIAGYNKPLKSADIIFGEAFSPSAYDPIVDIEGTFSVVVGLRADGTVEAAVDSTMTAPYYFEDQHLRQVKSWTNIVAVAAGGTYVAGLKADGTVVAAGSLGDEYHPDLSGWTDITAIDCTNGHIVGLRSDGTVLAAGKGYYGEKEIKQLRNMNTILAEVCSSGWYTAGIRRDGAAYSTYMDGGAWFAEDVVDIASSGWLTLALRSDGTVAGFGEDYGLVADEIADWRDIKQALPDDCMAIGLKRNGTVVTAGYDDDMDDVRKWKGITKLFGDGEGTVIGLKEDGTTVVHLGGYSLDEEDARKISSWRDIEKIVISQVRALGLKADGSVVAAGGDEAVLREIQSW